MRRHGLQKCARRDIQYGPSTDIRVSHAKQQYETLQYRTAAQQNIRLRQLQDENKTLCQQLLKPIGTYAFSQTTNLEQIELSAQIGALARNYEHNQKELEQLEQMSQELNNCLQQAGHGSIYARLQEKVESEIDALLREIKAQQLVLGQRHSELDINACVSKKEAELSQLRGRNESLARDIKALARENTDLNALLRAMRQLDRLPVGDTDGPV